MITFNTFVAPKDEATCWGVYTTTANISVSVPDPDTGEQTVTLKGKVCKECVCKKEKPASEPFNPVPGTPGETHTDTSKYVTRECGPCPVDPPEGCLCKMPDDAEKCINFDDSDPTTGNNTFPYVREKFVQKVKNLQKDALRTARGTLAPCE
jgi:hypothetical protein